MKMKKAEKQFFVDNLAAELKTAKSVILINYTGLTVKAQQELKKRLEEVKAKMIVVKNTLLKRAAGISKLDSQILTDEILTGQTALVIGTGDSIAPLQVLGKFAKEFESGTGNPIPKFKVGIVDNIFQDEATLVKISALPGRDALLGQLLGSLMASQYGLVGTLNANIQKLLFILNEKSKSQVPNTNNQTNTNS
jgi:large subunit ribosomal protein L10